MNLKTKSKPELKTEKQHKGKKCGFFPRREELHDSSLDLLPNNSTHLKAIFGTSMEVSTVLADKQKFGFALKVKIQQRNDW